MNFRDHNMTIPQLVDQVVATYGHRKCLTYEQKTYTYTRINQKMNQVAHGLHKLGVSMGSRIGLFLSNCPEYLFSYFGVLKLGGVNVPINTFLSSDELHFILNDCDISVVISDNKLYKVLESALPKLPQLKHIIVVGEEIPEPSRFRLLKKSL